MQSWQVKASLYKTDTQPQFQVSKEILLIAWANSHMFPHKDKSNKN
jgi:hypothetical protein